jgi:hypothetical protein
MISVYDTLMISVYATLTWCKSSLFNMVSYGTLRHAALKGVRSKGGPNHKHRRKPAGSPETHPHTVH